jgi:hypothetical protein
MLGRNAARNQKERYLAWHEIPWTRNDDRVPIVIENVDKMFLKLSDLTAPVKSDKRRFVKTNPAARRQHLRGADTGYCFHRMAARPLDSLEKLKSGEMEISHKHDNAFHSLMMQGSDRLKLVDLVLVTHFHSSRILCDERPDYLHYSSEAADYVGFLNQFPAMLRHIAEIARACSNTINHNVVASFF